MVKKGEPSGAVGPSLTYVIPKITVDGDEHFAAVQGLLRMLATHVNLHVIAERGDRGATLAGVRLTVLPAVHPLPRLLFLLAAIRRDWQAGGRTYFVRVSRVAALVAGLWCRLFGGKLYYWHSGAITYHPWKSWHHCRDWLVSGLPVRLAFRLCHQLVTGPESMRKFYVHTHGVPAEKIIILPNDVDVHRFRPASGQEKSALRGQLGLPAGKIAMILHRLSPVRRHTLYFPAMLTALEANLEASLVIVGDGPERLALEKLIARSPARGRVFLAGAQPHARVHDYLRCADLFLNPSYVEGFPRVVIEAMACGLPVLVTDAGGTADLLPASHRSWAVSRHDPQVFGRELSHLLAMDAVALRDLGDRLADHAQQYSTAVVAGEYMRKLFGDGA